MSLTPPKVPIRWGIFLVKLSISSAFIDSLLLAAPTDARIFKVVPIIGQHLRKEGIVNSEIPPRFCKTLRYLLLR